MTRFPVHHAASLIAAGVFACLASIAHAQAGAPSMEQWAKAKTIFYRVEGVYSARRAVAYSDNGAMADVRDRVALDMEWNLGNAQLVKLHRLDNFPAEAANLANGEPKCMPPVMKGKFELGVLEVAQGYAGDLMVTVETSWPAVEVVQFCTGKRKLVAARKKTDMISVPVASPVLFSMPGSSPNLAVSADRKSLIVKQGEWTWTFTPSLGAAAR